MSPDEAQNELSGESVKWLSSADWPRLRKLFLSNNPIGPEGILYFGSPKWAYLEELRLDKANLGQLGCRYLAKARLNSLRDLLICTQPINRTQLHRQRRSSQSQQGEVEKTEDPRRQ